MSYLGDFPTSGKVSFLWNTNGQDGASITRSTDGTLKIFKSNATAATWATERSSLAGVTQLEDFDQTGIHSVYIDLSDNTDAGFYAAGNEYQVAITGATIDTKTVSAVLASFSIERAGGILEMLKSGTFGLSAIKTETASIQSDTNDIQTRLPAALTAGGNMKTDTLYEQGAVWINTGAGAAGTTNYVHGTVVNPNSSMANSRTIADALNLKKFMVLNGSSVTLDQGYSNYIFMGERWTLALANRLIAGSHFAGADVSGLSSGTGAEFDDCTLGNVTIANGSVFSLCRLNGTFTCQAAGTFIFAQCHSQLPAGADPIIDFGALGATTVLLRDWAGGIELQNMAAGDVFEVGGRGRVTINANCTGGTVRIRGAFVLINNGSGQTIEDTARWNEDQNVTNVTGNVAGSVGSVTGAVGSVTGNVGGNVVGSVGSVTGAVGSVTGNVGGNVVGSVGSVTGAVGSVTGAVGSVTGNLSGNVVGSVGSVVGAVGSVTGAVGSVGAGGIAAASFAAGAIDATAIANGAIDAATFAAGAIDAAALATDAIGADEVSAAAANKIADHIIRRTYANARASANGDAVAFRSLLGALSKLVNLTQINGANLETTHEDDSTVFGTQAVTTNALAEPITKLDTA